MTRPACRYLRDAPPPVPSYSSIGRAVRNAVLFGLVLWLLAFAVLTLAARS